MLKQRVITAAVIVPVVIAAILLLSSVYIGLIFTLVLSIAAWEWFALCGLKNKFLMAVCVLILITVNTIIEYWAEWLIQFHGMLSLFGLLWWLVISGFLILSKAPQVREPHISFGGVLLGLITMMLAYLSLSGLHRYGDYGPYYVLYALVAVWVADIGAYFAGRRFGKIRLAPVLSPGKTLEGGIGGMLGVVAIALMALSFFDFEVYDAVKFILISLITGVFSITGDLFESLLKRQAGVKDSGSILPGHGGALDRIDSLLAAIPVFFCGVYWWL